MRLGRKLGLLFVALFVGLAALELAVQQLVLLPSFEALDRTQARRNVQRVVDALGREVELLAPQATDWATSDETYDFVVDRNEDFRVSSLTPTALAAARVDLLAIFAKDGSRVWSLSWDSRRAAPRELAALTGSVLPPAHPLRRGAHGCTSAGLLDTPDGPFLVAARPILTSAGEGPPRGCVVVGRRLDNAAFARQAAPDHTHLWVGRAPPVLVSADNAPEALGPIRRTTIILEESEDVTRARAFVLDLAGEPILKISVETPRDIAAHGKVALRFAGLSLAGAAVLVLLLLLLVLRHAISGPVSTLTEHVAAVGRDGDLSRRVALPRDDEIGTLAREFDRMIEQLADARQRLLEQSYRSGLAELAGGVLHNIGNAVTPIGVKLVALKDTIRTAPLAELERALRELADPATSAVRRADLTTFVEAAAQELAAVVQQTRETVAALSEKTTYIQEILADQARFGRAERVTEPIELGQLVARSARLLPERLQQRVTIEIDPGLDAAGRVVAAPVALQQVVSNLLINAAEAVLARGEQEPPGRVSVTADRTTADDRPAVHLRFTDNGVGIPSDVLPRIFERGFSTKQRGSGMGLHWSANVVAALGGRLTAESEGTGRGACLHLVLPLAAPGERGLESPE